jgi:hypothetical protein
MRRLSLLVFLILAYQNCSDVSLVSPITKTDTEFSEFSLQSTILDDEQFAISGNFMITCRSGRISLYQASTSSLIDQETITGQCQQIAIDQDWIVTSNGISQLQIFKIENQTLVSKQTLAKPTSSNSLSGFGLSLSIADNVIVAGDLYHGITTNGREGAAIVYSLQNEIWTFKQQIFSSDPATSELFGHRVVINGDSIFVSARYDNSKGAVYVFNSFSDTWAEVQKISSPESLNDQQFGYSISVSGNYLVVGAVAVLSSPIELSKGSVYIYEKDNTWEYKQKLVAENANIGDFYGYQVSVSGQTIAVSAPQQFLSTQTGYVDLYHLHENSWIQRQKIAENAVTNFGRDLLLTGYQLLVRANRNTGESPIFIYQPLAN